MTTPQIQTDRDRLKDMVAFSSQPALTEDQIETALYDALVPDSHGRWTDSSDYVETFDLNRAAGKLWRMKASIVASDYSITIQGRGLSRSEMFDHFIKMAKVYEAKQQVRSFRADGGMDPFYLWERGR